MASLDRLRLKISALLLLSCISWLSVPAFADSFDVFATQAGGLGDIQLTANGNPLLHGYLYRSPFSRFELFSFMFPLSPPFFRRTPFQWSERLGGDVGCLRHNADLYSRISVRVWRPVLNTYPPNTRQWRNHGGHQW